MDNVTTITTAISYDNEIEGDSFISHGFRF